jgi:hypothetical protein
MDSYNILVIILSVALGISIFIWILVGALIVQVLKKLRTLTDSAQTAAENVEEFTSHLRNAGKMSTAGTAIAQITKLFKGKGK